MANKIVYVDSLDVQKNNFEDLLVTDNLFVEFFNEFLQLPTFPEPLCFNRDTGGFEIVSAEKKEIAKRIKAAIRSGMKKSRIFYPVRHHSFKPLPKLLMEEPKDDGRIEIDTTFSVKTLNKEQGIEWIKAERLPAFLESDTYVEYRLAKLLSQVEFSDGQRREEFLNYKIERRPRPPTPESSPIPNNDAEINQVDEEERAKQSLLKDLYVSLGDSSTTQTELWVAAAQVAQTQTVQSDNRPISAFDSGLGSKAQTAKPVLPRPSDPICVTTPDVSRDPVCLQNKTSVVYIQPKSMGVRFIDETDSTEDAEEESGPLIFSSVDDIGAVVVATAIKQAFADVLGVEPEQVAKHENIRKLYPNDKYCDYDSNVIDSAVYCIKKPAMQDLIEKEAAEMRENENKEKKVEEIDDGDDKDSALESDEEESDTLFKRKPKPYSLDKLNGIRAFANFLTSTAGEKNWLLWHDIDRLPFVPVEHLTNYISAMRERYHAQNAAYRLSDQLLSQLDLHQPFSWNKDHLLECQHLVIVPLLTYWAPRFLLQENQRLERENSLLIKLSEYNKSRTKTEFIPTPKAPPLLPRRSASVPQRTLQISDAFAPEEKTVETEKVIELTRPKSARLPMPPLRPAASRPTTARPGTARPTQRAASNNNKTPKQLIEAKIKMERREREEFEKQIKRENQIELNKKRKDDDETSSTSSNDSAISSPSSYRPSSSASNKSSAFSEESNWFGGRRMEGLLNALVNERRSGGVFGRFVEKSGNSLWSNCLAFWQESFDYVTMFDDPTLNLFELKRHANALLAKYIVEGSPMSINACRQMQKDIERRLNPPFDDLFAGAEELALDTLFDAWTRMLLDDCATFEKVQLIEVTRRLDTKSKHLIALQRRGVIKDIPEDDDISMDDYADPVYDETLIEKIPEEFRDYSFEKLIHNRIELEYFRKFLADNYASMDLMCWMDIETFKRLPHTEEKKRDEKAKETRVKYLNKKYFFGVNSPAGKDTQNRLMESVGGWGKLLSERPPTQLLLDVQKIVETRLIKKWLPLFLATDDFGQRQRPPTRMSDAAEDVGIQRRRKVNALHKMLDSKWISSSKDVLVFRKALLNPITSLQFRKFVSLQGDNLENDVLFWQEVQRYKEVCHNHCDRNVIIAKITSILNCFIDSAIPPSLQIDVPQEMADRILNKKNEAGPYLFREAQLTVFRVLFEYWEPFCKYRQKLSDDKIIPTIERHRRKFRQQQREKERRIEQLRDVESAEKRKTEVDDENFDPFAEGGDSSKAPSHLSWSYGQYMNALHREELLNEVDESTFSSSAVDVTILGENDESNRPTTSRPKSSVRKGEKIESSSQTDTARALPRKSALKSKK